MLNSFLETDFLSKGLQSVSEVNLDDRPLVEQLEYCNVYYLINLYSNQLHYKKAIRILQKFIKKNFTNLTAIEQILLTCIKFEDKKLLEMNLNVYKRFTNKQLEKIRIFKELSNNVIQYKKTEYKGDTHNNTTIYNADNNTTINNADNMEIIYFNNKCSEIFAKLSKGDRSWTYQSFVIYRKNLDNFLLNRENRTVYNYRCNTAEYNDILKKLKDYLLYHMDINIIFLHTYISKMGCLLTQCENKCSDKKDKELRDLLLNDLYLLKNGIEDREFILKFYNRRKNLVEEEEFLDYECTNLIEIKYKTVVHRKQLDTKNRYITKRKKSLFASYSEDMYTVIGSVYTKKVRNKILKKSDTEKENTNNTEKGTSDQQ